MNLEHVINLTIEPAYTLLPERMRSPEATRMMLAIGLQESRFRYRVQLIGNHRHWWESLKGPARGYWQFERGGGVRGVLNHRSSRQHILHVLESLDYPQGTWMLHRAIAHNDIVAAAFARLLLWTHPKPLPTDADEAWQYYLDTWRPGKPHPATWGQFWQQAQEVTL